ncbi:glycosyltransferase [Desulfoscipio sp. XC116]|uniref:glycosyltransferase n=1 Tax=Desulfoscipio sp. XC116 TaxID=3144975 RepID=UPI00325BD455
MLQKPLVSVIILCYNNYQYLKETLWSVIAQDYPRIQIVISDDSSDYFPVDELIHFMNNARVPKAENVLINVNEKNMGTVGHLEYVRKKCTGEYVVAIAGDDVFFDSSVITNFVNEMERLGDSAQIITAQAEMWDLKLQKKHKDFVSADDIELIKKLSPKELFEELALRCFIPALCFCRKSFFERIGELSSTYRIVEDWSTHLRACRMGIKIHWLDIVSMKHRDGGVSHGNTANSNKVFYAYLSDFKFIYDKEILPYLEQLSQEKAEKILDFYDYRIKCYNKEFDKLQKKEEQAKRKEIVKRAKVRRWQSEQNEAKKKVKIRNYNRILHNAAYKFSRKNHIALFFAGTLMSFITASIMSIPDDALSYVFRLLFMVLGCCAFLTSVGMVITNLIMKIKSRQF